MCDETAGMDAYANEDAAGAEAYADEETAVLASRAMRLGGAVLDTFIWLTLMLPIALATGHAQELWKLANAKQPLPAKLRVSLFLIGLAVYLVLNGYLLFKEGQTIGKLILRMRIVDSNGHVPNFGTIYGVRYLLFQIIAKIPYLYIGPASLIVDPLFIFGTERRCLHDYLAGTWVIETE